MKPYGSWLAAILFAIPLCYAASVDTTTKSSLPLERRVVGGVPAREGQFPYQVMLIARTPEGSFLCGGAVVSPIFVITAAHCVHGVTADNIQLLAGNVDRKKQDWVTAKVGQITMHEDYNPKRYINDIAILELDEELPIDGKKIGTLAVRSKEVTPGTNCIITGWGSMKQGGDSAQILQYVSIPIVDRYECSNLMGKQIEQGEICAGFKSGGKDSCQGDSGGPLVCDGLLTGVVSWGDGCAKKNKPGVYANVLHYWSWLQERIGTDIRLEDPTSTTTQRSVRTFREPKDISSTPSSAHSKAPLTHIIAVLSVVLTILCFH